MDPGVKTMDIGRIILGLLATAALPASVQAQESPLIYNAKPEVARTTCEPQEVFDLVAIGAASTYRATKADAPGGFDPAGVSAVCGSVTRAVPLSCVTSTGVRAKDQSSCEPAARSAYERRNYTKVYRAPGTGYDYYMAETRTVGATPLADAVRLSGDIYDTCLQISEVEIYSNGVNVALASKGATVSSTPPYNGSTPASLAIDGQQGAIYHSTCSGGNWLMVTLPSAVRIDRIVVYGRNDEWGRRDIYNYQVLSGSDVQSSGQIDSRNKAGSATPGGSCVPQTFEWRTVPGTCVDGRVQNAVTCNDAGSGAVVDVSRCNASMRPASSSTCSTQTQTSTASIPAVQVGWCGYTSSGGGRYACGPLEDKSPRAAFAATWPYPSDLCTGKLIESDLAGTPGGKNWVIAPVTRPVKGAQCVIHMKSGYSGHAKNDRPTWESYYYDGPPTGHPGGTYINKKP